jgi:hypothetical protein
MRQPRVILTDGLVIFNKMAHSDTQAHHASNASCEVR